MQCQFRNASTSNSTSRVSNPAMVEPNCEYPNIQPFLLGYWLYQIVVNCSCAGSWLITFTAKPKYQVKKHFGVQAERYSPLTLPGVLVGEPRKTLKGQTDGGAMRYPVVCAHCRAFTSSG